jgi:O-methyltransferase involved in polyketide biosynthesis
VAAAQWRPLRWLDVDLPEVVADRQSLLGGGVANCQLETIALDLAVRAVRKRSLIG